MLVVIRKRQTSLATSTLSLLIQTQRVLEGNEAMGGEARDSIIVIPTLQETFFRRFGMAHLLYTRAVFAHMGFCAIDEVFMSAGVCVCVCGVQETELHKVHLSP